MAFEGIMLATKKIRQVSRLMQAACIEIIVEAFGPKCFVIISIHINESHEIRIPPSSAIQSSCRRVLFASRFIHTTLTENNVTTVAGIDLSSILVSLYNFMYFSFLKFIFDAAYIGWILEISIAIPSSSKR